MKKYYILNDYTDKWEECNKAEYEKHLEYIKSKYTKEEDVTFKMVIDELKAMSKHYATYIVFFIDGIIEILEDFTGDEIVYEKDYYRLINAVDNIIPFLDEHKMELTARDIMDLGNDEVSKIYR